MAGLMAVGNLEMLALGFAVVFEAIDALDQRCLVMMALVKKVVD